MDIQHAFHVAGIVTSVRANRATKRISDIKRIETAINKAYSNPCRNSDKITNLESKLYRVKGN